MSTLADRARGDAYERPVTGTAAAPRRPRASEAALIGWLAFAAYLALGLYMSLGMHGFFQGDAMSRLADAYYVLFSRDPHLAAIGFVWNPLPAVLDIPLAALHPWWPEMVSRGVGAAVLSAAFGGLSAYFLSNILNTLGLPRPWRIAVTVAYLINPFIVLYSGNGMTAVMLIGALLGCLDGLLRYQSGGVLRNLLSGAVWLSIAFLIRYEAAAFGVAVAVALVVSMVMAGYDRHRIEGALILFLTPLVYAAGIWVYFNWLIMKNPLYFMNSAYSNGAQMRTGQMLSYAPLLLAHHSWLHAVLYAVEFTALFWPIVPAVILSLRFLTSRHHDPRAFVLIAGALSIPLLQVVLLYLGDSSGVDRYFAYFIPLGVVLSAFVASKLGAGRVRYGAVMAVCVTALVLGNAGTLAAERSPVVGHHDGPNVQDLLSGQPVVPDFIAYSSQLVGFINRHPGMTFLMDTFEGYHVAMEVNHLTQIVISSDLDFESILENPRGRVDAFIVPRPDGVGLLDAVNRRWPGMWAGKVSWAHLVAQFPQQDPAWRIYTVDSSSP